MTDSPLGPKVLVFTPSLDDDHSLAQIVGAVGGLGIGCRCLVIDDGSDPPLQMDRLPEGTLKCRLLDNMGIGVCTNIALQHAARYRYDVVVRIDADNQHPVNRIRDLIEGVTSGGLDIVAGTRTNRNEGHTRLQPRRIVRGYFRVVTRWLTRGNSPSDVNTGFIAFGPKAIESLRDEQLGRFPEPELFVVANRRNLKVGEVVVDQAPRLHGSSTLTFFAAARMIMRFTIYALDEVMRRIL